jgi:hypothetical protein
MMIGIGQAQIEGEVCYLGCPNSVCENFTTGERRLEPNPSCVPVDERTKQCPPGYVMLDQGCLPVTYDHGYEGYEPPQPQPTPGRTPQPQPTPGRQPAIGFGAEGAPSCALPAPWSGAASKLSYAQWAYCNRGLVVVGAAGLVLLIVLAGRRRR